MFEKCPNCQSPLELHETTVCPYCHASTTGSGASLGGHAIYGIAIAVALLIFGGIFAYDYTNGTEILPAVWEFIGSGD